MKHQSRELNVFSMSALDLFASGMGAFVLLAVTAMPFFPNTETSSQRENLQAQLESAQSRLEDLENLVVTLSQSPVMIPPLDIVICLDITGSMYDQIDGLKAEISALSEVLDKMSSSVGIGIVAFGDRKYRQPIYDMDITETSDMTIIQSFVDDLTPGMNDPDSNLNSDGPEAVTTALEHATTLSWRSESETRFIIVITDNAAYPDREAAAVTAARIFSSEEDQYVSTVRANIPGFDGDQEALRFLKAVAEAGQGNFVDAAGGESILSSLLLAIL